MTEFMDNEQHDIKPVDGKLPGDDMSDSKSADTELSDSESADTGLTDANLPDSDSPGLNLSKTKAPEQDTKKNKKLIKIILPIILALLVAGVWLIKNNEKNRQPAADNPDFVLTVSEIDLEHLKSYGLPIVLDFGSDSCGPCIEMAPTLKKINADWQGKVIVKFTDVWKYTEAAGDFPLDVIPTQFFFDADGNPYVPSESIGINFILYSRRDTDEHVYTAHKGALTEEEFLAIFEELGVK